MMLQARCQDNLQLLWRYVNLATKAWAESVLWGSTLTIPVLYFAGTEHALFLLFLIVMWSAVFTLPVVLLLGVPLMFLLHSAADRIWVLCSVLVWAVIAGIASVWLEPIIGVVVAIYGASFTACSIQLRRSDKRTKSSD